MESEIYDDIELERLIKAQFGLDLTIDSAIIRHFPISRTGTATIFLTTKKQLYIYTDNKAKILLADVKKIISRVGLKAELYIPPKGRPQYFDEVAVVKFREVFPGRTQASNDDLEFYRTLAPYNPGLVLISEVKNGEIFQFDSDNTGKWRLATKFAYRRIRTN
ncbi:MAG: hypothetical protein JWN33_535 [Candidatus Saccharibacteria bacterium]|nr:hypothetical protein [Candidatus Saccharibacteria bacterium]